MIELLKYAFISVVWASYTGIPQWIKWKYKVKRIKPIDCELCLAFWIEFGVSLHKGIGYIEAIINGLICAGFAVLILKISNYVDRKS